MISTSSALTSRVFALLFMVGLIGPGVRGQGKDWKDIIPLSSTETETDKLAGEGKIVKKTKQLITYYLSDMRIEVELEPDGYCSKKNSKWNVGKGTVIALTVNFIPSAPFQSLGFDKGPFKTHKYNNDLPGIFLLADVDAGRVLEVEERAGLSDLLVRVVRIEPSPRMARLKCHGWDFGQRSSQH